jgi:hypothetical protein
MRKSDASLITSQSSYHCFALLPCLSVSQALFFEEWPDPESLDRAGSRLRPASGAALRTKGETGARLDLRLRDGLGASAWLCPGKVMTVGPAIRLALENQSFVRPRQHAFSCS